MTPEDRELLRHSIELGEENNAILRGIQRSMRISRAITIVYWLIIIGTSLGAYYFLQPYMEQIWGVYNGAKSNLGQIGTVMDMIKASKP
jgi:hypothetical protein